MVQYRLMMKLYFVIDLNKIKKLEFLESQKLPCIRISSCEE